MNNEIVEQESVEKKPPLVAMGIWAFPLLLLVSTILLIPFVAMGILELPLLTAMGTTLLAEAIVIFIAWKVAKEPFTKLFKVNKLPIKKAALSVLVGAGFMVVLQIFSTVFYNMGVTLESSDTAIMFSEETGVARVLTLFLIAPLIVPVVEELLFRGVIYGFLAKGLKKNAEMKAAIFSATMFGIAHFQGADFTGIFIVIFTTIFGYTAALLYQKYNSIVAPILAHIFYNLVNVIAIIAVT